MLALTQKEYVSSEVLRAVESNFLEDQVAALSKLRAQAAENADKFTNDGVVT